MAENYPGPCPNCGDFDDYAEHVTAREPIAVDIGYVWPKLVRRRAKAVREGRRRPRKTAEVIQLSERRPQPWLN